MQRGILGKRALADYLRDLDLDVLVAAPSFAQGADRGRERRGAVDDEGVAHFVSPPISRSRYHLALRRSSTPPLRFQRHVYLLAFAVQTASIPSRPVVAASSASMHSIPPAV